MPIAVLLAGASGAILGFVADRLAARWPEHEVDTEHAIDLGRSDATAERDTTGCSDATAERDTTGRSDATAERENAAAPGVATVRRLDWRTALVVVAGVLAFAALFARWSEPRDLLVLGIYLAALIVLLATDLDQKLLPDLITFPLMAYALAMLLLGWNPLLEGKSLGLLSGIAAGLGAPVLLFVTDRILGGALGIGDLKLAVSLGLMSGVSGLFAGFVVASALSSVVLLALIATRRIGLRSAIPFGPVLIAAGMIAALLPA